QTGHKGTAHIDGSSEEPDLRRHGPRHARRNPRNASRWANRYRNDCVERSARRDANSRRSKGGAALDNVAERRTSQNKGKAEWLRTVGPARYFGSGVSALGPRRPRTGS